MTFFVFSLGCKVNSYECSALSSIFIKKGYVEDKNNPDIIVINTCSVTSTADQKSRQHIRKFKNKFPNSIIVVMGCFSQGNYKYIFDEIKPTIVVGTSYRNKIPELIDEYILTKKRILMINDNPRKFDYEEMGITSYSENTRAYLKIQDGCNNFCTYCLIPYRRGKMRSREINNILDEAKYLVSQGYQEIVLTGIHVGGYGQDLNSISFSDLVEKLCDIKGLKRLRISSIEESEIDDKLIYLIQTKENLAKHLHIPLQSGSKTVLERMNRKYNPESFINKISKIRSKVPDFALSTDVIVGFPGETSNEFNETKQFIIDCGFDMLHVFPFSAREGTVAYDMDNQIEPQIKSERAQELINLSAEKWNAYCDKFVGKEVTVLYEQYSKDGYNIGHTSNYLLLKVPSNCSKVGEFETIRVEKSMIQSK